MKINTLVTESSVKSSKGKLGLVCRQSNCRNQYVTNIIARYKIILAIVALLLSSLSVLAKTGLENPPPLL